MEILAPAGGMPHIYAAVRSGADAVYLGTKKFNARRNAANFDDGELCDAIKYCHARGVRVYVAFNTLITDSELESAADEIKLIAQSGADAVIVQDMAAAKISRTVAPQLAIHASTQMTIHNCDGVRALESFGFSRVVPARELSFEELLRLRAATDMELEVFVHGALCMSVSGQCYLSGLLGQRSANRGLCAQPCRLDFHAHGNGHVLSLKDLSAIDMLKMLSDAGIDSAKIEGRMKRPEYVAAATRACKAAINGQAYNADELKAVFSRSGFTNGYLLGKIDRDMFGYRTKEDVTSAAPVLKSIAASYRKEVPLIKVDMQFYLHSGKNACLSVTDGTHSITVFGVVPEAAISRAIDSRTVSASLSKCGGTPFYTNSIVCDIEDGLAIPVSAINSIRSEALDKLLERRSRHRQREVNDFVMPKLDTHTPKNQLVYARYKDESQITDDADRIIIPYDIILKRPALISKYGTKLTAELPLLLFNENGIENALSDLKNAGIETLYVQNQYALYLSKKHGFKAIGGYALNILNSLALDSFKDCGLNAAEISFECTLEGFNAMKRSIPCGLTAYGKMPLMTYRNCPMRTKQGCGQCDGKQALTDRLGNKMTVLCRNRQFTQLINPQPIFMADKLPQLKNADFLFLHFTDETQHFCRSMIKKYRSGGNFNAAFTRGLYYKAIK